LIHNEQPFSRIHKANLINFGILRLEFVHEEDLKRFYPGDRRTWPRDLWWEPI
jgi:aconitase A